MSIEFTMTCLLQKNKKKTPKKPNKQKKNTRQKAFKICNVSWYIKWKQMMYLASWWLGNSRIGAFFLCFLCLYFHYYFNLWKMELLNRSQVLVVACAFTLHYCPWERYINLFFQHCLMSKYLDNSQIYNCYIFDYCHDV